MEFATISRRLQQKKRVFTAFRRELANIESKNKHDEIESGHY